MLKLFSVVPVLLSDIIRTMFLDYKKNYEFSCFVNKRNPRKTFHVGNFEKENSMLIARFEYVSQSIYLDNCVCLHYHKSSFYRTIIKIEPYPIRKCYSYCKRNVKRLFKYFLRFII